MTEWNDFASCLFYCTFMTFNKRERNVTKLSYFVQHTHEKSRHTSLTFSSKDTNNSSRLDVVYLHVKYEKPIWNDKKVTARTRFVTDGQTDNCRASATLWRGPNKCRHIKTTVIYIGNK